MRTVQYLGGLTVLISFDAKEIAESVLKAARDVLGRFSSVDLWEGQTLCYERLAWLKVKGIPLQLITDEVIDSVGSEFGRVVHRNTRSEEEGDLSYEYIGVLVGDGRRVAEEIMLQWRGRRFRVWVLEELGDWVPEILDAGGSQEGGDEPNRNDDCNKDVDAEGIGMEECHEGEGAVTEKINGNGSGVDRNFSGERDLDADIALNAGDTVSLNAANFEAKVGKKPKASDPFGLNSLLDISDEEQNFDSVNNVMLDDHMLQDVEPTPERTPVSFPADGNVVGHGATEMEETIRMGAQLGAQLENFKDLVQNTIEVKDRVRQGGEGLIFHGCWYHHPYTVEELSEMQDMSRLMQEVALGEKEDEWECTEGYGGKFSVAHFKGLIRQSRDQRRDFKMRWEEQEFELGTIHCNIVM
ncbi:hypothetical protein L1987_59064 [Smallanthus sonchifolius]|uniref:Uncharacterized protein n=1 Tax=Smallanthus sonchifolius TaxID=185202 RepID=A0ACB9D4A1_9ASTR|nr:hypothetical protein L1987_59064 [Smallanthus sonchifolius]